MDDKSDWVWLEHPETGGKALFAPAAAPLWRGMGWFDTSPAPEPNVLRDEIPASELVPVNEPVEAPTAKPAAAGTNKKEPSRG